MDRHSKQHPWSSYRESVRSHQQRQASQSQGYSAKNLAQRFYEQCCEIPIPPSALALMPKLFLPLRVHLIRSEFLGCSEAMDLESVGAVVRMTNEYWAQAGIRFDLTEVRERCFDKCDGLGGSFPPSRQEELREIIDSELTRGSDGKMRNKGKRADVFLGEILAFFNYRSTADTFNVWIFDMIGQGSQGCHIDSETHTIILGERSTKGYAVPTRRPQSCLAKTMAHELGHALGLGHPRGRVFLDGRSQTLTDGRKNLMMGGSDRKGGGGDFLEQWQICLSRYTAEEVLASRDRNLLLRASGN